ncbi:hypothetical protein FHETE_11388 [Fusarium heterosporum]|uniref:Uncharacterized protein n=1 Tax=Fusarium heterosporum TaxID=42747 RepID=A0A8H5SLA2_FUSHE|nr:hypothetical protein FHETE_11388 [Fusarium heterosporum]
MPQSRPARSVLELLTHLNPSVRHEKPRSKTETLGAKYHFPQQIGKWEEFEHINILKAMFGDSLLQEAFQSKQDLNPYPILDPDSDCRISAEDDTRDLINSWNKKVLTSALKPIQHVYSSHLEQRRFPEEHSETPTSSSTAGTTPSSAISQLLFERNTTKIRIAVKVAAGF